MKNFLETNIYEFCGTILLCGSCLPDVQPIGFRELYNQASECYCICLERDHINMVISKLIAVLGNKYVNEIIFATVDKSPYCIQMHYITHEIERILPNHIPMKNYVVVNNKLIQISSKTIALSKFLSKLEMGDDLPLFLKD